jgi:hypothetical protein
MSQHQHALNVECPQCHHVFDVEASLSQQIEKRLKADLAKGQKKALADIEQQRDELERQKQAVAQQQRTIDQQVEERLQAERKGVEQEALNKAREAQALEMQALKDKAKERDTELARLKKEQLDLLDEKEKLERAKADLELETKKALAKARKTIEEEAKQRAEEEFRMQLRQKELALEQTRQQLEEAKRKAEQGSMQTQGEAQELELQELLEATFRQDAIEEVSKGANGADVLHHVQDHFGRHRGTIAYESKRTKAFSDKWIEKLKEDMQRHKAEVGVIVTETMPKDMPEMGVRDGVFICTFREARALAQILRDSILRLAEVRAQEHNRDDKAQVLYAYFTSPEFKRRMQVIVQGYATMKQQLDAEKRLMQKQWAAREKQLDALVDSATELQGSILGIAGNVMEALTEGSENDMN